MAAPATQHTGHVIAGEQRDTATERIEVRYPATEQVIGSVPAGTDASCFADANARLSATLWTPGESFFQTTVSPTFTVSVVGTTPLRLVIRTVRRASLQLIPPMASL